MVIKQSFLQCNKTKKAIIVEQYWQEKQRLGKEGRVACAQKGYQLKQKGVDKTEWVILKGQGYK